MIGPTKEEREKIARYEAVKNEPADKQDLEAKMIFKAAADAMDAVAARKKRRTDFGVSLQERQPHSGNAQSGLAQDPD